MLYCPRLLLKRGSCMQHPYHGMCSEPPTHPELNHPPPPPPCRPLQPDLTPPLHPARFPFLLSPAYQSTRYSSDSCNTCMAEGHGSLLLVHAHNVVLVDSLAGNHSTHGIALLQGTDQLLLLALQLNLPLLKLALQTLLVTLQSQEACTVSIPWLHFCTVVQHVMSAVLVLHQASACDGSG